MPLLADPNSLFYQAAIDEALRLSETPEAQGGWAEYFDGEKGLDITDTTLRAHTAMMLENAKQWLLTAARRRHNRNEHGFYVIDEAVKSSLLGGFSDHLFPVIRAAFPTNPLQDLVSVQPTSRRTATIVYLNFIYGTTKGAVTRGQRMFDANVGIPFVDGTASPQDYTGEYVSGESVSVTLTSGDTICAGQLDYFTGGGIKPGSVAVTVDVTDDGLCVFYDNGNGAFGSVLKAAGTAANVTISASSINYATGAFSITAATKTFKTGTTSATATYWWNSEGSPDIPEIDVQIVQTTAETVRRALRMNYSQEAVFDVMAEMGLSLEPQLVAGAAEYLNYEISRQIIREIWGVTSSVATFNIKKPDGISLEQHYRSLTATLQQASNNIWKRTQKGYGNWMVVDEGAANVVESMPRDVFERAPRPQNVMGLHFIGTYNQQFRVYKDLHLRNETGASATGNILMGFKGTQFFESGLVWAPYQMLYTTDTLTTADFLSQKGMASRYATKMANSNFYTRISLSNS